MQVPPPSRRVLVAWLAGASLSGVPSTLHALATGRDPLQATRAAATLVPGGVPPRYAVAAGAAAHLLVSAGWTAVLAAADRRRPLGVLGGGAAGLVAAAAGLEVAGRAYPEIRALPRLPQWLDHVAFGAIVCGVLSAGGPAVRRRRS